ncbi:MAG: glutathione S-transferase family protein [Proteobacteria bacterium]|nr:MAG: glutathione S-transferase family protein [Pseudomonadota bacterium]
MTYVVYGNRRSGSCAVELALAEIGASVELRDVSLEANRQHDAGYASINPARKLPTVITPDGERLTESLAILLLLAERHPDAALLPPSGAARAQAIRWLCYVATEIYPLVEINDYPERFAPDAGQAGAVRARAREIWRARWLVLEAQIAGEPWLLAWGFTLADMYLGVVSRWAQQDDWRPANLPRVERIACALAERPATAAVWARHFG